MVFRSKYFFFSLLTAIIFSGCSLWNNFTTYFNLYYNASDIFEDAEKQIKEQQEDLFSTKELPVPGSVNTQLVKVVEKCSEILQFHSESAYVDDALLILGKAFYYQKNYQKANRKFEELLATQDEESDLILETEFWVGKTQMKLKNYETALTILARVREEAIETEQEEILQEAFVEEIVYRINEEDYQEAILLSNQLLEKSDDEDIKAEVLFETGKLYIKVDEVENAIAAFERVLEYNPLYEIELGAKLELGKTLRIAGRPEEALEVFIDMRDEIKFSDTYGEIDLQTGITLEELGRTDEAVEKLVLVDTSYVNTPASSIAKFKLGEIYEYDYENFDTAGFYYQKSLTSSLPAEYQIETTQKIRTFKKYQHLKSQINNFSSQLFYIENPEDFTRDSLTFVTDSAAYVQDSLEVLEELSLFSEHIQSLSRLDTSTFKDTVAFADSLRDSTIVMDSTQLDSIRQRERELAIKNEIAKRGLNIDSLFAESWDEERKFPAKPIKSKLSEDSLKSILAKNEVELGNLFLTEMERFDSAYYYYDHVLTYYPGTIHQANALYAMGSYYLNTNQKEKADSLFNYIYENYKNESIVNAAANQLNKPLIDLDYDPAKEIYSEAEHELFSDNFEFSLEKFFNIYKNHPKSPVAPKALFTSGWILENELNLYDSAAVLYDTLTIRYPQSEFTSLIRPKLNQYKQYQAELQKAIQDSIQRINDKSFNLISEDSLGVMDADPVHFNRPPDGEAFNPDSDFDEIQEIQSPELNDLPRDTSKSIIINNPRRNPRKK
jgi:TolA-binding protein